MKKGSGKEHEVCHTTPFRRVASTVKEKGSEGPAQRRRRWQTFYDISCKGRTVLAQTKWDEKYFFEVVGNSDKSNRKYRGLFKELLNIR
jgi:Asp-tRNA(Asn)/Glu-tRNA(Gln) amidotransferase B subunit